MSAQLSDFDNNGTLDLILSKYFAGEHPIRDVNVYQNKFLQSQNI